MSEPCPHCGRTDAFDRILHGLKRFVIAWVIIFVAWAVILFAYFAIGGALKMVP